MHPYVASRILTTQTPFVALVQDGEQADKAEMKLLIVEDNPTVRRLIRRAIAEIADEMVERNDGAEALEAYEAYRPDIVLMDVKMPLMDGLAATRQLVGKYPRAKVVIVTDYNDDDLRQEAHDAGACAYALKHNLTDLEEIVQAVYRLNAESEV
jgi:DNA-binding NarL/FixJ family response regulator